MRNITEEFKIGKYFVSLTFDSETRVLKEIEIEDGTYKYVDLTFEELELIYNKVKELIKT